MQQVFYGISDGHATLLSLLRTDRPLDDALASGQLRLQGDRAVVEKFRRLFPLPEPEAATPAE
jgi:ubiquinone biosynthesis protein UbiJ